MTRLEETKKMCESFGKAQVESMSGDLNEDSQCKYVLFLNRKLMEQVIDKFGRIDILVLNAGVNAHFTF